MSEKADFPTLRRTIGSQLSNVLRPESSELGNPMEPRAYRQVSMETVNAFLSTRRREVLERFTKLEERDERMRGSIQSLSGNMASFVQEVFREVTLSRLVGALPDDPLCPNWIRAADEALQKLEDPQGIRHSIQICFTITEGASGAKRIQREIELKQMLRELEDFAVALVPPAPLLKQAVRVQSESRSR